MEIRDPRRWTAPGLAGFLATPANSAESDSLKAERSQASSSSEFSANLLRQYLLNQGTLAETLTSQKSLTGAKGLTSDKSETSKQFDRRSQLSDSSRSSLRSLSQANRESQPEPSKRSEDSRPSFMDRLNDRRTEETQRNDKSTARSSTLQEQLSRNERKALPVDRERDLLDQDQTATTTSQENSQTQVERAEPLPQSHADVSSAGVEANLAEEYRIAEKQTVEAGESFSVFDEEHLTHANSNSSDFAAENAALNVSNSFAGSEIQVPSSGIVPVDDELNLVTQEPDSVPANVASPAAANQYHHIASRLVSTKSTDAASIRSLQSFQQLLAQDPSSQSISGNTSSAVTSDETNSATAGEVQPAVNDQSSQSTANHDDVTIDSTSTDLTSSDTTSISLAGLSAGVLPTAMTPPAMITHEQRSNPQGANDELVAGQVPGNRQADVGTLLLKTTPSDETSLATSNSIPAGTNQDPQIAATTSLQTQSESIINQRSATGDASRSPNSGARNGNQSSSQRHTSWSAVGGVPPWSSLPGLGDAFTGSSISASLNLSSRAGASPGTFAAALAGSQNPAIGQIAEASPATLADAETTIQIAAKHPGAGGPTASLIANNDSLTRQISSATSNGTQPPLAQRVVVDGILNMTASHILNSARTEQTFSIVLTPESYGELSIDVRQNEKGVMVRLEAATSAGHELLSEHLSELREILDQRGLDVDQISLERVEAPREVLASSDPANDRSSNREQPDANSQNLLTGQEGSSSSGSDRQPDSGTPRENWNRLDPQEEPRADHLAGNIQEARSTQTSGFANEGSARPVRWDHVNIQI
ncbi:Flagellar hook-length control protein FliK [Planctopirus ephydatiae]|uniref:Flagellar hook-length control protein FliK n=2 Tax=Planctopirus ephydatiae TaxID=2528019 RepID=A0A518GTD4_9PLAN|nr:Flagellar hook-length control protein FliK [Planctopirus ephydatiae]